jgi:translation initiation factor 2 gamma subunit (eIF-2gamma)
VRFYAVPGGKAVFKRDKPHLNVGTSGHVDHGKLLLHLLLLKYLLQRKELNTASMKILIMHLKKKLVVLLSMPAI